MKKVYKMVEASVNASIGKTKYYTEIVAGENRIVMDEPTELGGQNKGFSPHEALASALASCTIITLRMYLDRKEWNVEKINIKVELDNDTQEKRASFTRSVSFEGADLTDEQLKRLHSIANACPIHKILTNAIEINTTIS